MSKRQANPIISKFGGHHACCCFSTTHPDPIFLCVYEDDDPTNCELRLGAFLVWPRTMPIYI
jgi:hypothetical protein